MTFPKCELTTGSADRQDRAHCTASSVGGGDSDMILGVRCQASQREQSRCCWDLLFQLCPLLRTRRTYALHRNGVVLHKRLVAG